MIVVVEGFPNEGVLVNIIGWHPDGDDIAQEARLRFWTEAEKGPPVTIAWYATVIRNLIVDWSRPTLRAGIRAAPRTSPSLTDSLDSPGRLLRVRDDPTADDAITNVTLNEVLAVTPPALLRRALQDATPGSDGAERARVFRARASLRRRFPDFLEIIA